MNAASYAEHGKKGLIESIEEALMRDPADPVELCGFIEVVTGGSRTSGDFRGQMEVLRKAGRVDLLWELGKRLKDVIADLRNATAVHPQDIELYESSAEDALLMYHQLENVLHETHHRPKLVENNRWTEEGDRYRKQTRIRMHKSLGQSNW